MRLIPVIDLKGGEVVRAIGGVRRHYRTLRTPLCAASTLCSVGGALIQNYFSSVLYIADLDAIEGIGTHAHDVTQFCSSHPKVEVWMDSGVRNFKDLKHQPQAANIKPVVGTETLGADQTLTEHQRHHGADFILSLDFREGKFIGPVDILDHPERWPGQVIAMTMDAVGKGRGPDFETLESILKVAKNRDVYAAGGVRSTDDLKRIGEMGAVGALVSTALHAGKIKTGDLDKIAGF